MSASSRPSKKPTAHTSIRLLMYVAGGAPNSVMALINLRSVLAEHCNGDAEVEVIDLLKEPWRGLRDRVLVTPMLLRIEPLPERCMVGTLSDRAALLAVLGVGEERG
jgi:circadian clock protein KaiB